MNILPGNSGGPIIDADGHMVGVAVMVAAGPTGSLAYAVSIDQARPILDQLKATGKVVRAKAGLLISAVNSLHAGPGELPDDVPAAIKVHWVAPGSPAAAAGITAGDIIYEIDGEPARRKGDFFLAMGPVYNPGTVMNLSVWRPAAQQGQQTGFFGSASAKGQRLKLKLTPGPDAQ